MCSNNSLGHTLRLASHELRVLSSFALVLGSPTKATARNVAHFCCFCKTLTQNYWLLALDAIAVMPVLDFTAEGNLSCQWVSPQQVHRIDMLMCILPSLTFQHATQAGQT